MKTKYIIFDLDDTLFYEVDFLKSAYKEIAYTISKNNEALALYEQMLEMYHKEGNVFDFLQSHYTNFSKEKLLEMYRNHFPTIKLNEGAFEIIKFCKSKKYKTGIITDGRSVTQRNKLKALNIEHLFDKIIISEEFGSSKPDRRNFLAFQDENIEQFFYIADNPKKDFVTPNQLGWTTVCLLNKGQNIHSQVFTVEKEYLPKHKIKNLKILQNIIF